MYVRAQSVTGATYNLLHVNVVCTRQEALSYTTTVSLCGTTRPERLHDCNRLAFGRSSCAIA